MPSNTSTISWVIGGSSIAPVVYMTRLTVGLVETRMDDLVGVTDHGKIGVVGYDDNLATLLCMLDRRNEHCRDRLVIEVLFWLVDDKRKIAPVDE